MKEKTIMKKTYIQPISTIVFLTVQQMIAESLTVNSKKTLEDSDEKYFLSREGNTFWEDED